MKTRSLPGRMVAHLTVLFMISSVLILVAAPPAHAATIEVDSTEDNETADDGDCTLREAANNANSDSDTTSGDCEAGDGADTIELDENETYELDDGDLDLTDSDETTIDGGSTRNDPDDAVAVIDGGGDPGSHECDGDIGDATDRVIEVEDGASVELVDIDVRRGILELDPQAIGAGVLNEGDLTLTRAAILNNVACATGGPTSLAAGGGVASAGTGTLTITDSTVDGNLAVVEGGMDNVAEGGGLWIGDGTATIEKSTFSNNSAEVLVSDEGTEAEGGGISANQSFDLENSTLSGNSAVEPGGEEIGGGLYQGADTADLLHVTTTENAAENGGGLATGAAAAITLEGNVTADQDEGDDCFEEGGSTGFTSNGWNLDSDDSCEGFDEHADDIEGDDADLDGLDDNGGPTETHLPDESSDAVDAIETTGGDCETGVDEDQRGEDRPDDEDDDECDAGSVEHQKGAEDGADGGGGGGPAGDELDATPETATNIVPGDVTHSLTAAFDESELDADEDDEIDAKITSGPNEDLTNDDDEADLSCTLSNDRCTMNYTGNGTVGTDVICVWLDTDDDDAFDLGDSEDGGNCDVENLTPMGANDRDDTDVVEKRWVLASPTPSPTPPALTACNDNADNDGDGEVDFPADRGCSSASDTTETGTFRVGSTVSIRHQAAPHRFKGRVRSARARCRRARRVVVKKVRRGPDRIVGRDVTNRRGRWSEPHLRGGEGRYYAQARRKVFTGAFGDTIICRRARSSTIRAGF